MEQPKSAVSALNAPEAETLIRVLDAVRLGNARSRSEVAATTGLSRSITAARISELIALGLMADDQFGPSSGGRPARTLVFQAQMGHVLAAYLGATRITVGATDLAGAVLAHHSEPTDVMAEPDVVVQRVTDLFDEMLPEASRRSGRLRAIGVGIPLPVEITSGRPVAPPSLHGWDGYPLRNLLAQRYGTGVWVDNDVNVLALGEWRYGVGRNCANMVMVKIGTGIGAATIGDGMLHRGAQGTAGYIGHIHVSDDPSYVCGCGRTGCLEALAGGAAIAREAEAAARAGESPVLRRLLNAQERLTARDVSLAAGQGDPVSVELLQRSARQVGTALAALVNITNPSLLVIGGGVANAGDAYLATVREVVHRLSLPLATRYLHIQRSSLGVLGGLQGAAVMALDHVFSPEQLPWTFGQGDAE